MPYCQRDDFVVSCSDARRHESCSGVRNVAATLKRGMLRSEPCTGQPQLLSAAAWHCFYFLMAVMAQTPSHLYSWLAGVKQPCRAACISICYPCSRPQIALLSS